MSCYNSSTGCGIIQVMGHEAVFQTIMVVDFPDQDLFSAEQVAENPDQAEAWSVLTDRMNLRNEVKEYLLASNGELSKVFEVGNTRITLKGQRILGVELDDDPEKRVVFKGPLDVMNFLQDIFNSVKLATEWDKSLFPHVSVIGRQEVRQ